MDSVILLEMRLQHRTGVGCHMLRLQEVASDRHQRKGAVTTQLSKVFPPSMIWSRSSFYFPVIPHTNFFLRIYLNFFLASIFFPSFPLSLSLLLIIHFSVPNCCSSLSLLSRVLGCHPGGFRHVKQQFLWHQGPSCSVTASFGRVLLLFKTELFLHWRNLRRNSHCRWESCGAISVSVQSVRDIVGVRHTSIKQWLLSQNTHSLSDDSVLS